VNDDFAVSETVSMRFPVERSVLNFFFLRKSAVKILERMVFLYWAVVTHRTPLTFDNAVEQTINLAFVAINEGHASSLDLFILGVRRSGAHAAHCFS
jgi:hypothetical protein